MFGTIVNSIVIVVCSFLGLMIKGLSRFERPMKNVLGLSVLFIGIAGAVSGLTDENANALLFIIYLIIGTILGELMHIDAGFKKAGDFLGQRFSSSGTFSQGFVTASLIYCIGAMGILGCFESGLTGNHQILYTKSILDGVMSVVFASTMGIGVAFSALPVLLYQGAWTLLAGVVAPFFTPQAVAELSLLGNVLIAAIGMDMLGFAKINYANMLPAIFLPVFYHLSAVQNIFSGF